MEDFEKLGSFYLGKAYDLEAKKRLDNLILYDSKDLVTHAVCVGMTGSGKTGLCLGLLEEAAIDNIPALIIDPKGDLGNLMLTFPNQRPEDFRPWINESDAATKGVSPDAFAASQAQMWAKGIADWGQSPDRIKRLREAADVVIYTPGSNAGIPLAIIRSFDCPPDEVLEDRELLTARVQSMASSILSLVGVKADPIKSREHILVANILTHAWNAGKSLDLPGLIAQVQQPPFTRIGVLDIESFYPSKDRFALAMDINNLLAAPGFSQWMEGEPLDIANMLYTKGGKPRLAIVSIAHLNDNERMFIVSMVLNQMLSWVRQQSGTTSLRAILYMDEIAGYFPPTANPPSKQPLLTLMKQARAFGVGVVVATQNPVDLDYKGLANAGTWFIGRLQTEQDKARLLDGLEGAMSTANAAFDRRAMERTLSSLGKRVFLMNNVHEDAPVVFETRFCMSYLRGPLTRAQVKQVMDPVKKAMGLAGESGSSAPRAASASSSMSAPNTPKGRAATPTEDEEESTPAPVPARGAKVASGAGAAGAVAAAGVMAGALGDTRPVLAPDVPQYFLPVRASGKDLFYKPMLLGFSKVRFADTKSKIDVDAPMSGLVAFGSGPVPINWDEMTRVEITDQDVEKEPEGGIAFEEVPAAATKGKAFSAWQGDFADAIFRTQKLELLRSPSLAQVSLPDENERDFRSRLQQKAREERDAFAEKLRQKYASKTATLEDRVRRAQQTLETQKSQATGSKLSAAVSFGAAILGGFLGRKSISSGTIGKAATAVKGVQRSVQESGDVKRAEENIGALTQQLEDLQAQFKDEVDAYNAKVDPATEQFEAITLRPKKTNIAVQAVVLAWVPFKRDGVGRETPAWE